VTRVMIPGLPYRRHTRKNHEAKFLIIQNFFFKKKQNKTMRTKFGIKTKWKKRTRIKNKINKYQSKEYGPNWI
jgi:hypothetical protein